jgi:hypothetical protein
MRAYAFDSVHLNSSESLVLPSLRFGKNIGWAIASNPTVHLATIATEESKQG